MIMKRLNAFLLSLVALLLLGASTVLAQSDKGETDLGALQLNHTYNIKDAGYFYGTFTPEQDGFLQVYSDNTATLRAYKSWAGSAKETMALADNGFVQNQIHLKDNYAYNYELKVTKGTKYYMCVGTMAGDDVHVTLKMEPKTLVNLGCSVNEGAVVSPTTTSSISFSFNRSVVASSGAIIYGDNKEESVSTYSSSTIGAATVAMKIKDVLINLANAGSIKEGDVVTLKIKDIKEDPDDAERDGTEPLKYGDLSVKVKIGQMPAMLLGATMDGVPVTANTKFMTYYAPGTGKLVLNFSKELDPDYGEALLRFGDFDQADNGGYYQEDNDEKEGNFTMEVKGKQVILDFSGKRRAVNDMVSSTESDRGADFTKISLQISKITDLSGIRAYSTSSTTAGRFNYTWTLDVPEANVSSDFTPANGGSLKDADNVEIWISDEQSLSYQGVVFTYDQKENGIEPTPDADGNVDIIKEVVVDKDHFTRVADPDEEGAVILTVPVPEEVKNLKNVTVSLYKVTCVDGKDYTNIIAAKYNVVATGIDNISVVSNKAMKVYNLNGQLVREGKTLDGLHGIYVVNGMKIVLK